MAEAMTRWTRCSVDELRRAKHADSTNFSLVHIFESSNGAVQVIRLEFLRAFPLITPIFWETYVIQMDHASSRSRTAVATSLKLFFNFLSRSEEHTSEL